MPNSFCATGCLTTSSISIPTAETCRTFASGAGVWAPSLHVQEARQVAQCRCTPKEPGRRVVMHTTARTSEVKEDLQSLPLPELQTTLAASPEGLSDAEAQRR